MSRTFRTWSPTVATDRQDMTHTTRYRVYALDGSSTREATQPRAVYDGDRRFVETSLFIDRDSYRSASEYRYGVWLAGGDPSGCARYLNGTNTLSEAVDVATRHLDPTTTGS